MTSFLKFYLRRRRVPVHCISGHVTFWYEGSRLFREMSTHFSLVFATNWAHFESSDICIWSDFFPPLDIHKSSWIWNLPATLFIHVYFKKKARTLRYQTCFYRFKYKMTHNPTENHPNPHSRTFLEFIQNLNAPIEHFYNKTALVATEGILFSTLQLLKCTEATWVLLARNEEKNACHHC